MYVDCRVGWSEIHFWEILRVLAGRTSEMLLKIKTLKICWINSKTEARTELKCVQ